MVGEEEVARGEPLPDRDGPTGGEVLGARLRRGARPLALPGRPVRLLGGAGWLGAFGGARGDHAGLGTVSGVAGPSLLLALAIVWTAADSAKTSGQG